MRRFFFRLTFLQSFLILGTPTMMLILLLTAAPSSSYEMLVNSAAAGFIYVLLAFFLYPLLIAVKHLRFRKLVLFTRVYIRFHIALAVWGALMLFPHAAGMPSFYPVLTLKAMSGSAAAAAFMAVLLTGYFRKQKSSGKRRRYHRYAAFVFVLACLIHVSV
ncbi:hypothetical protein SAMN05192534_10324 [Alteribacillus persepolensis]|uniref:Ferric reductase like transmembrane component n=1 Tax=Alteribacillus persepolensis TaxID=568899 RepID=A0A1G8AW72_9BACI|nr:hypothetical protein [Alteribacillus persepolensis]SDH24620.1 hypothetical protein SAMN05192534_10324 [Alteribacillus persepolensis]